MSLIKKLRPAKRLSRIWLKYDVKLIGNKPSGLRIVNNQTYTRHFVFVKPFAANNRDVFFESSVDHINGGQCTFKLLARNFQAIHTINPNKRSVLEENRKMYFVAVSMPPKSECRINSININICEDKEKFINSHFNGDILLITPGYPSEENKYNCAFVHSRMKAYKDLGWKVDLVVVNDVIKGSGLYSFEGIDVLETTFNNLRTLLQTKHYPKILIHFFNEKYAQILDATDLSQTKIYLYSHGADTMYWDYGKMAKHYFSPEKKINNKLRNVFLEKDRVIKKYNLMPNVKWVFVTNFTRDNSQKLLGIEYLNSCIIPCPVDEKEFYFTKRDPEARKKICIIRKFDDISSYSIDIDIRVILELSKRKLFKELEFSIYGDGSMHEILTAPVKDFSNVHIHKKFISHQEMAEMYNYHGIALFATRYDSQAVASCEAAMTGAVVITSKGVGVTEFIDPKLNTYCDTEDIKQYADLIEKLYLDENMFLELGPKMHESALSTCGYDQTVAKDIKLLESDPDTKIIGYKFKPQIDKPVLTIAVPAYNVELFLRNGVHSLINHPQAHKIEILIIDDGSKDNTSVIARELEKQTTVNGKPIVKLIKKKNGGHGSAINAGIKAASGKYFKLMDGDDYFDTEQFVKLIEILETETSDIVLTNYVEDFAVSAVRRPVHNYSFMAPGVKYDLDTMTYDGYGFKKWGPLLSTTTCKTELLQKEGFQIDEHCFYVDMEYNFIVYSLAKDVVYYPLDIYIYYLGRQGQSMTKASFTKNYLHHEKVCIRLLDEFESRKANMDINKQHYLENKIIIPMCKTQYQIATEYFNNSSAFLSFDKKLKKYPDFYNNNEIAGKLIKLHRMTKGKNIYANSGLRGASQFAKNKLRRH